MCFGIKSSKPKHDFNNPPPGMARDNMGRLHDLGFTSPAGPTKAEHKRKLSIDVITNADSRVAGYTHHSFTANLSDCSEMTYPRRDMKSSAGIYASINPRIVPFNVEIRDQFMIGILLIGGDVLSFGNTSHNRGGRDSRYVYSSGRTRTSFAMAYYSSIRSIVHRQTR
ncbi:hypothetical protein V2G26_013226 [Clonostachys chloroleuca]